MPATAELTTWGPPDVDELPPTDPMPGYNHSAVQINLALALGQHPEFRALYELDLQLNDRPLRPDLCLYRRRPLDLHHEVFRPAEAPLTVVEILSAGQGLQEVMERKDFYLAAGVMSFWLVAPPLLAITIFTPDGEQQTFVRSGGVTDPATGVTVDLEAVFR